MNELTHPPSFPYLLLSCSRCGHLHEPQRPLACDLNPLCLRCAPPELRPGGESRVGPFD